MRHPQLDRSRLRLHPLDVRPNKLSVERDFVLPEAPWGLGPEGVAVTQDVCDRVREARAKDRPVVLAFGAHTVKNGMGLVIRSLIERGWVTHLATNGAGIIHDWEFAFLGETSEDVRVNTREGKFGTWQETGFHINLAILLGAFDGLGYGESVGRLIATEGHVVPERAELLEVVGRAGESVESARHAGAAADLLAAIERFDVAAGRTRVPHRCGEYSLQAAAYELGVPFTAHPMFGHDIIYTHPMSCGAAIGRTAERDFLTFAHQISRISGGVYLSVGSAVMSPMVFEKSMSMGQNLAIQRGERIEGHFILVVDLAESAWNWARGEPPIDRPEYYLRYCKTFSRMGGTMRYLTADNRDFLLGLCRGLG